MKNLLVIFIPGTIGLLGTVSLLYYWVDGTSGFISPLLSLDTLAANIIVAFSYTLAPYLLIKSIKGWRKELEDINYFSRE